LQISKQLPKELRSCYINWASVGFNPDKCIPKPDPQPTSFLPFNDVTNYCLIDLVNYRQSYAEKQMFGSLADKFLWLFSFLGCDRRAEEIIPESITSDSTLTA
jgi:hypothetical protein